MTIQLPSEAEQLPELARERLVAQVNAYAARVVRDILNDVPEPEAVAAIAAALQEDPSEEMTLEQFAAHCGVKL